MRRAAWCLVVCAVAPAHAGPTTVTAEGGAEADTNVQRVETGVGSMAERIAAPVARLGAKVDHRGHALGGAVAVAASSLARVVLNPSDGGAASTRPENVALLSGELRWLRAIGRRAVSAGLAVTAADAIALTDATGARTFRTLGADAVLVLHGGDDRTLTFALGWRDFVYKPMPMHELDWTGPTATARLDLTLWQPSGGTRSLELALVLGFDARSYDSPALASACPDDAEPDPRCYAPTALARNDRFQRGGLELIWTGGAVAAVGYQLSVTDSNSYGQSLARHRLTLSATTNLRWGVVGTVLGTLQLDKYLDGVPIETDTQHATFTTLDDDNRSSLQVRLARQLSRSWAFESRAAIWRNLGGNLDTSFRRAVLYVGAVYSR